MGTIRVVVVVVLGDPQMGTGVCLFRGPLVVSGPHARLPTHTQQHFMFLQMRHGTRQQITKHRSTALDAASRFINASSY